MTEKDFNWTGGTDSALENRSYTDGNKIEAKLKNAPEYTVFGWHNVSTGDRNAIKAKLGTNWTEGEERGT